MAQSISSSGVGTGGMTAKIEAAKIAQRAGIALAILNGTHTAPISHNIGCGVGSIFLAKPGNNARKAWLGGRLAPEGAITVDDGCVSALDDGASVLAAGVIDITGEFQRGALVSLQASDGTRLGQGLVEYSAAECRAILGLQIGEQERQLGYAPRAAVVHRNHMVRI